MPGFVQAIADTTTTKTDKFPVCKDTVLHTRNGEKEI
jgi:hypothetical protein